MLEKLAALSRKLRWARPVTVIAGLVCCALFIASIFGWANLQTDSYLIPSLLGMAWSALCFAMITLFPHVPAAPANNTAFFSKAKVRLQRGLFYLLGLLFLLLSAAMLALSYQLIRIWSMQP